MQEQRFSPTWRPFTPLTLRDEAVVDAELARYAATLGGVMEHRLAARATVAQVWRGCLRAGPGMLHMDGRVPLAGHLLRRGIYSGGSDRMVSGEPRLCHINATARALRQAEPLRLMWGYALRLDVGLWVEHSWLVDDAGRSMETTVHRDAYWGMELSGAQVRAQARLLGLRVPVGHRSPSEYVPAPRAGLGGSRSV